MSQLPEGGIGSIVHFMGRQLVSIPMVRMAGFFPENVGQFNQEIYPVPNFASIYWLSNWSFLHCSNPMLSRVKIFTFWTSLFLCDEVKQEPGSLFKNILLLLLNKCSSFLMRPSSWILQNLLLQIARKLYCEN